MSRNRDWTKSLFSRRIVGLTVIVVSLALVGSEIYLRETKKKINSWLGFGVNYLNPVEEAEFVASELSGVKLGNNYVTGGYLIWRLFPETKIMIDPRAFPYRAWYAQYNQAFWGGDDRLSKFVANVKCDAWCISLRFTKVLEWFRKQPEWKLLNYGPCAATFARKDLPVAASSPLGSAGIADIVVPGYSVVVLNFATNNSDLEGAVSIARGMRGNFGESKQLRGARDYLNGFFAYFLRDYESAVLQLNSARNLRVIGSDTILVNSYQLRAAVHWNKKRHEEALDVMKAALEVNSNNMISIFNAGVIGWYLEVSGIGSQQPPSIGASAIVKTTARQDGKTRISEAEDPKIESDLGEDEGAKSAGSEDWREHLETFVENVKGTKKYPDRTVRIAEAILRGKYNQRPPLMVPPEPDKNHRKRIRRLQAELNEI